MVEIRPMRGQLDQPAFAHESTAWCASATSDKVVAASGPPTCSSNMLSRYGNLLTFMFGRGPAGDQATDGALGDPEF